MSGPSSGCAAVLERSRPGDRVSPAALAEHRAEIPRCALPETTR